MHFDYFLLMSVSLSVSQGCNARAALRILPAFFKLTGNNIIRIQMRHNFEKKIVSDKKGKNHFCFFQRF